MTNTHEGMQTDAATVLRQRVHDFAAQLDSSELVPHDWYNLVDLSDFDISDFTRCLFHYLFYENIPPREHRVGGCFSFGITLFAPNITDTQDRNYWALEHGVTCGDEFLIQEFGMDYNEQALVLNSCWLEEISQRRLNDMEATSNDN